MGKFTRDISNTRPADVDSLGTSSRNTLTQESMSALRQDSVNIQFQYNLPLNEDTSDISGDSTGTGTSGHEDSKAVLGTGAGVGYSGISSVDSIRYFPGHEFYGEMTAVSSTSGDLSDTKIRWGIGDRNGVGDSMAFSMQDGVFGIELRSNGVNTFIPSSSFNGDPLDGTGPSGKDIRTDFLNLWTFRGGWYGILPLQFGVYAGKDIGYIVAHTIDKTNSQTTPHLSNPTLPMYLEVERSSGSGDNITIGSSSIRGGVSGPVPRSGKSDRTQTVTIEEKPIPAGTSAVPVLSLRNNPTFQGKTNHVRVRYGTISLAVDGTKPVVWQVFKGGTLTGESFQAKNTLTSVVDYDVSATDYTTAEDSIGGTLMGKAATTRVNLFEGDVILAVYPGETITLAAKSSGNTEVSVFFRWIEEF